MTSTHLVGSVPLENETEVFKTVSQTLKNNIKRIPDGETGVRTNWIAWQIPVLENCPQLEKQDLENYQQISFSVKENEDITQLEFGDLGYASEALASYAQFKKLKDAGEILEGVKFQVSLPTPLAPIFFFVDPSLHDVLEGKYENKLKDDLDQILSEIPHEELSIQWDTAVEFGILEGLFPNTFENVEEDIINRLVRYSSYVPEDVDLGYHLCYGDAGHQHFCEPSDTTVLVKVINGITQGSQRQLQWFHIPVPRDRSDVEYFQPLSGLQMQDDTELFLGLVHITDGYEGSKRRYDVASTVVSSFGVSTECGLGRRPAETIPDLLEIHRRLCEE